MGENNYITIFGIGAGKDGQATTRFDNVSNFKVNLDLDDTITFDYISASTGKKHSACFFLDNISGYSIIKGN